MATVSWVIVNLVRRLIDAREDFVFSHDPEFVASLEESDARLRAGEGGSVADLERELSPRELDSPHAVTGC